jgi:hypothetical protein
MVGSCALYADQQHSRLVINATTTASTVSETQPNDRKLDDYVLPQRLTDP